MKLNELDRQKLLDKGSKESVQRRTFNCEEKIFMTPHLREVKNTEQINTPLSSLPSINLITTLSNKK